MRIDLASGGPTLFEGTINNIHAKDKDGRDTPRTFFCLGSIRAHAPETSADTTFLDTFSSLGLHATPGNFTKLPFKVSIVIDKSRELKSLIYQLNMMKKINLGHVRPEYGLQDGIFLGPIYSISRTYRKENDSPEVHLELANAKLTNWEPRNPNVIPPRSKRSS